MTDNPPDNEPAWQLLAFALCPAENAASVTPDDREFARTISGLSIPHWSTAWPRINALSRAGLLRVSPTSRWAATVTALDTVP